jgi:hypothetical protein
MKEGQGSALQFAEKIIWVGLPKNVRVGTRTKEVSTTRAKISYYLSHKF